MTIQQPPPAMLPAFFSSRTRMCLVIFILGLASRAAFIIHSRQYLDTNEGTEIVSVAHHLAERGEFADPYKSPTGPTAHVAPGYPFFLSTVYRLFGTSQVGELIKECLASSAAALTFALLPVVASVLQIPLAAGFAAGIAGAAIPLYPHLETKGEWEAPYTALSVLVCVLLTAFRWRSSGRSASLRDVAQGSVWGLSILIFPNLLVLMLGYSLAELLLNRERRVQRVGSLALMFCCAFVVQAPWMVRNWVEFHTLVLSRNNFGQEIFYGNHEGGPATSEQSLSSGELTTVHPNCNLEVDARIRAEGETRYNSERLAQAKQWILANPGSFLRLTALHFLYIWLAPVRIPSLYMLRWLYTILAPASLALMFFHNRRAFWLLLVPLLLIPAIYYFTLFDERYSYPFYWVLVLLGAYALYRLYSSANRSAVKSPS